MNEPLDIPSFEDYDLDISYELDREEKNDYSWE